MASYAFYTYSQRPELVEQANALNPSVWPEFMLNDPVANRLWHRLEEVFPDYQFVLCDADDRVIAAGNTIPFSWEQAIEDLPDNGWDAVLEQGFQDQAAGKVATLLSALSVTVSPGLQGQGISSQVLRGMRTVARAAGLKALVAPVRPTLKSRYPLIPIDRYVGWLRQDGAPFDPWLRTHWKQGARIVKVARSSMMIPGTLSEWEAWTGMAFPETGEYVVPGALVPVQIDLEADCGLYVEPNVWMLHHLKPLEEDDDEPID